VSVIERYIGGQPITANFIATLFGWPLKLGKNLDQLTKLEDVYEFFDVYLWLSYRFPVSKNFFIFAQKLNFLFLGHVY
jgi:hypothetical protein